MVSRTDSSPGNNKEGAPMTFRTVTPFMLAFCFSVAVAAPASAINCVQYVKQTTGIELSGDAWKWWVSAEGRFERGRSPETDAVMVFSRTKAMRSGHVAIVREGIDNRTIRINH